MITEAHKTTLQAMEDATQGHVRAGALVKAMPDGRALVQFPRRPAPHIRASLSLSGFKFYLNAWRGKAARLPEQYR